MELPPSPGAAGSEPGEEGEPAAVRLVDWVIAYLAGARETERRIVDVARRYEIRLEEGGGGSGNGEGGVGGPGPVEPPRTGAVGGDPAALLLFETGAVATAAAPPSTSPPVILPWLEAAVMFWATERVFVDAWSGARARQSADGDRAARDDADGGAARTEFIPGWSSDGAREFVATLQGIIDKAVAGEIERGGNEVREEILRRTEGKWRSLIARSGEVWMEIEDGVEVDD